MTLHVFNFLMRNLQKNLVSAGLTTILGSFLDAGLFAGTTAFPIIGSINTAAAVFLTLFISNTIEDTVFTFVEPGFDTTGIGMLAKPLTNGLTAAVTLSLLTGADMTTSLTLGIVSVIASMLTNTFVDTVVIPLEKKVFTKRI